MPASGLRSFAAARDLDLSEGGTVRPLTPALLAGSEKGVVMRAEGALAPGLEGSVMLLGGGPLGEGSTVILTRVAGSSAIVPALVCRDRRSTGGKRPGELPAERWVETELESSGFNRRYSLMTLAGQDQGLLRELFSPALIAWLEREPPPGFSFELNEDNLTVGMPGHLGEADLGRLCELGAEVASRIRAEIEEEDLLDADIFDESAELRSIERGLSAVRWVDEPESVRAAIDRYRRAAFRKPAVWLTALMWGTVVGGGAAVLGAVAVHPIVGLILGVLLGPPAFLLALLIGASRYRWGTASVARVGLEAFARGYARSRGLEIEDRWRFHAAHRDLAVPGFADHVFAGELPGTGGLHGRFLMLGDAAEMRTLGQEMAFISDRPLASSALLVDAGRDLPADAGSAVALPEDYQLTVHGRDVLVWRPIAGNLARTAAGSDRFCKTAGGVVRSVLGEPGAASP